MKKLLIDCDPGIDDALAILLALGSAAKTDVEAIVATFGNVTLSQTKNNLLRILSFFDKRPLLGSGSKGPLKGRAKEARHVHGEDGLGDLSGRYAQGAKKANFKDGIDLIIRLAFSNKIDKIVATGPLTDLARAIRKDTRFLENLDEIVIMGGAVFVKGNVTPYSEFNFHCDPEAANIVLNSGVRKKLIALDVTNKTLLTSKHLEPIKKIRTPLAEFITCISEYAICSNIKRGFSGAPMHDPLAAAIAIDDKIGRDYKELRLGVETKGIKNGKVTVKKGKPNALFCSKVDAERFFKLFTGTLLNLAERG